MLNHSWAFHFKLSDAIVYSIHFCILISSSSHGYLPIQPSIPPVLSLFFRLSLFSFARVTDSPPNYTLKFSFILVGTHGYPTIRILILKSLRLFFIYVSPPPTVLILDANIHVDLKHLLLLLIILSSPCFVFSPTFVGLIIKQPLWQS